MTTADDATRRELLDWVAAKRRHVVGQVEGLAEPERRESRVPSGWSPVAVVRHLTLDVDRFWFRAVMAGEDVDLPEGYQGWTVPAGTSSDEVLAAYVEEAALAERAVAGMPLDAAPAWWPEAFGPRPYDTLREVLLHVLVETATHAGQLDVVCELVDGRQRLVLDEPG